MWFNPAQNTVINSSKHISKGGLLFMGMRFRLLTLNTTLKKKRELNVSLLAVGALDLCGISFPFAQQPNDIELYKKNFGTMKSNKQANKSVAFNPGTNEKLLKYIQIQTIRIMIACCYTYKPTNYKLNCVYLLAYLHSENGRLYQCCTNNQRVTVEHCILKTYGMKCLFGELIHIIGCITQSISFLLEGSYSKSQQFLTKLELRIRNLRQNERELKNCPATNCHAESDIARLKIKQRQKKTCHHETIASIVAFSTNETGMSMNLVNHVNEYRICTYILI